MKMIRTPVAPSANRSLVVLLGLLLAMVFGIAAARQFVGASFLPAIPMYAPGENPAPVAPATDASSAPMPTTVPAPGVQIGSSSAPAAQNAAPVPAGIGVEPAGQSADPNGKGLQPGRLPSLDGNEPSPPFAPQGPDGKYPGFEAPPGN